jgi:glutaconate CoA-transferase subunit A
LVDADELAARIEDGSSLCIPAEHAGVSIEAARTLVRRGARDLHFISAPTSELSADLLVDAGCVGVIETSGVSLREFGPTPRFTAAVRAARVHVKDSTCPAVYAALPVDRIGRRRSAL